MVSYRFMSMNMEGNRDGTRGLSPLDISGYFPNVTGVGPASLRIVPTKMTMDMHMLGGMYAPTDWLTLMAMGNYIDKEMDHITFAGGNPDLEIGRFTTNAEGLGDTKLAGLFKAYEGGAHSITVKAGLSLPTGSTTEDGIILNPMGAAQRVRLPYAMQLGSGTYDLEPGATYTGHANNFGWGAQYNATFRLGNNDEGYSLGDKHAVNLWTGYSWNENLGTTLRLSGETESQIDGNDPQIGGPVQTAQTEYYGGKRVELGFGVNYAPAKAHSFAAEFAAPIYQNLNGPQLERDYNFTLGYQLRF